MPGPLSRSRCALALPALALMAGALIPSTASAAPELLEGPYLMDAQPDSMALLLKLSEEAEVEVTVETAGAEPRSFESAAATSHELVLDGLSPSTAYGYRVTVAGQERAEGLFSTAPPPGVGPIRFLVVGDNRSNAVAHAAVIQAMQAHPADFVLNTGDMVANGSVEADWREMFTVEQPLLANVPLFPTMGNHELYRNGIGLESFLSHTRVPRGHGGGDTYYAFTYGPARFIVLDSNDDWSGRGPQRVWLEAQLQGAREAEGVRHLFVAMHQGPLSSGHHGGHPDMQSTGVPELLRTAGVTLVLSGHDHTYERGDAEGLKYIVTGGGGAPLYPENARLPHQQAFEPAYHFLSVELDGDRVALRAIRADGSELETCSFEGRSAWECEPGLSPVAGEQTAGWTGPHALWWIVGLVAAGGLAFFFVRRARRA